MGKTEYFQFRTTRSFCADFERLLQMLLINLDGAILAMADLRLLVWLMMTKLFYMVYPNVPGFHRPCRLCVACSFHSITAIN